MFLLSSDLRLPVSLFACFFSYSSAFALDSASVEPASVEPVEFYRVADELPPMASQLPPMSLTYVAYSDDGKWIAVADLLGRVAVCDSQSKVFQLALSNPHYRPILQVAFLKPGETILCRDDAGRLLVCDVNRGTLVQTIQQDSPIVSFAFDKEQSRVLTISKAQTLSEWTVETTREQPLVESEVHQINYPFTRMSISDGGQKLLLASDDTWQIRRLSDLKRRVEATVDTGQISTVQISRNGLLFAVGFEDGRIRVRETQTGQIRYSWKKHPKRVLSMAFSSTEKTLISGCQNDRIIMWDLKRGEHANNRSIDVNIVSCLRLSPDDQQLAVVGASPFASLLRPRKPTTEVAAIAKPRSWNKRAAFAVRFVPQKNKVLVVPKFGTAQSIDLTSMESLEGQKINSEEDGLQQVDIAPDGSISAHAYRLGSVKLYDVETGLLTRQSPQISSVKWVQFDPTSKLLAILGRASTPILFIIQVETGSIVMEPIPLTYEVLEGLCWSPDSKALYTSGSRYEASGVVGVVSKWSVPDGAQLAETQVPRTAGQLRVSPDGQHVVTGGITGIIRLFDSQLEMQKSFECGGVGGLHAFCFVDNQRLVAGTFKGSVVMVDINLGTELSRFEPLPTRLAMPIRSIDYDPVRKLLAAVGGYDFQETTRLYRLEPLQP